MPQGGLWARDTPPTAVGGHSFPSSRVRARNVPPGWCRARGILLKTIKFFPVLPINVLRKSPRPGGTTLLTRWRRKKYSPWRKQIGGNHVKTRSPLRMESTPRPHRHPSRPFAQEAAPGKGSRRERLPRSTISSSRKERFSGIANRSLVIRDRRLNIKKVHGIRHFPVDTLNAIF